MHVTKEPLGRCTRADVRPPNNGSDQQNAFFSRLLVDAIEDGKSADSQNYPYTRSATIEDSQASWTMDGGMEGMERGHTVFGVSKHKLQFQSSFHSGTLHRPTAHPFRPCRAKKGAMCRQLTTGRSNSICVCEILCLPLAGPPEKSVRKTIFIFTTMRVSFQGTVYIHTHA